VNSSVIQFSVRVFKLQPLLHVFLIFSLYSTKAEICLSLGSWEKKKENIVLAISLYLIYFALSSACAYAMLFGTFCNAWSACRMLMCVSECVCVWVCVCVQHLH